MNDGTLTDFQLIGAPQATTIRGADGTVYGDVTFSGAYIDLPNGIMTALGSQATFEAWIVWNGPGGVMWRRIFDFGTSDTALTPAEVLWNCEVGPDRPPTGDGPTPTCMDAADANDDGAVNIADAIAILGHLFGGAGDLVPPFPGCGADPAPDLLPPCLYPQDLCR